LACNFSQVAGAVGARSGEVGIAVQRDVLQGERNAVDPTVEGHRLNCGSLEELLGGVRHRNGVDGTVLDEVTDPVMRTDHQIRASSGLRSGDELRLQILGNGLHVDGDAVVRGELGAGRLDGRPVTGRPPKSSGSPRSRRREPRTHRWRHRRMLQPCHPTRPPTRCCYCCCLNFRHRRPRRARRCHQRGHLGLA